MRRLLKVLRWLLIIIVVLVLLVGSGGYLWLRGALPQTSGTIKVQGVSGQVEIVRDADDIPHIRAGSEADAMFGLGYAHAQDRLWQMEFQRRIGQGRLSEVVGEPALTTDRFLRALGPYRAAQSAWPKVDPEARKTIEAYVAGVNAFISTHHGRALPVEFAVFGFEPEPWKPEDVLVWAKMMAWNLSGNMGEELLRRDLTAKFSPDKVTQLMPGYLPDGPIILPDGVASAQGAGVTARAAAPTQAAAAPSPCAAACAERPDSFVAINRFIQESLGLGGFGIGSNNWVVGGSHTTTGKPLLANDPHLGAQTPSIWYLAHVTGGPIDAIGSTLPGLPSVVIGHNNRIAWGVTNTGPDVQDLYLEHINNNNEVEYKGTWEPMKIVPEVIKIKGQPDQTLNVRITRHGPLMSDVAEDISGTVALRWTALDDTDDTIGAFLSLNRAQNWDDFTKALSLYYAPMQNFVYADVDGNIGYYAPGALPIRAKGDGTAPVPGWTGEYDWTGYVPFDKLPHTFNPPEGFIVSANNKVVPDNYPYFISSSWAAPYRAERITEMIQSKPKLSPNDIAAMQADVHSVLARQLLPILLKAKASDQRSQDAINMLKDWNGEIRGDSAQAAIYEAWYQQFAPRIFADELGDQIWSGYRGWGDSTIMATVEALEGKSSAWCDNVTTPQVEDCATTLGQALSDGLNDMTRLQGNSDMKSWRWDRVHHTIFPHNPFSTVSLLRPIFGRSIPNGGDGQTVDVGPVRGSELYNQYQVPSYREIIDLSNLGASRFMNTLGQSGYFLSGNYANLIERWQRVEYLPMRYDQATINSGAEGRLVLEP